MALIRVVHVQPGREPEVVEVDGEAGIRALLGGSAELQETQWPSRHREPPVVVYGPAEPGGAPNYWVTGADQPERGPRVIALLWADARQLRSMPDLDAEIWFWRLARWRFELDKVASSVA